jgi:DNA replication protein DnaC
MNNINEPKEPWDYYTVKRLLLENLKNITQRDFLEIDYNFQKLDTIVHYLTKDELFYESPILRLKNQSIPDFNKGLLFIGGVGTGKSSFLKAMSKTLEPIHFLRTTYHLSSDLVKEYEGILNPLNMKEFNNKYCNGRRIFDDLLKEKIASNFGKTNLIKELIANRSENNRVTFAAMNYHNQFPGNIEIALNQIGDFYDDFIYDRFFDMFNFVEFGGKSMRGKRLN